LSRKESKAGHFAPAASRPQSKSTTAPTVELRFSSDYNTHPRPAEVLVNGAEAELIRERETEEGLMAGEKI